MIPKGQTYGICFSVVVLFFEQGTIIVIYLVQLHVKKSVKSIF